MTAAMTARPLVASMVAALAGACAGDIRPDRPDAGQVGPPSKVEVVDNADGTATLTVNATDMAAWVYVDLAALAPVEPDAPATSADWDLGLQRFHYALDGGVSGAGAGALVVLDGVELADVGPPGEDAAWVTDLPDDEEDEDGLPELAFESADGGWYDYDDTSHVLTPKPTRIYVMRGASGALFALRIDAYYNQAGSAAWPKFTVKPLPAP